MVFTGLRRPNLNEPGHEDRQTRLAWVGKIGPDKGMTTANEASIRVDVPRQEEAYKTGQKLFSTRLFECA